VNVVNGAAVASSWFPYIIGDATQLDTRTILTALHTFAVIPAEIPARSKIGSRQQWLSKHTQSLRTAERSEELGLGVYCRNSPPTLSTTLYSIWPPSAGYLVKKDRAKLGSRLS
jgi:hypothetical protein